MINNLTITKEMQDDIIVQKGKIIAVELPDSMVTFVMTETSYGVPSINIKDWGFGRISVHTDKICTVKDE